VEICTKFNVDPPIAAIGIKKMMKAATMPEILSAEDNHFVHK